MRVPYRKVDPKTNAQEFASKVHADAVGASLDGSLENRGADNEITWGYATTQCPKLTSFGGVECG